MPNEAVALAPAARSLTPFSDERPLNISLSNVRKAFPITARRAYLNNASISPVSEPVLQAVDHFLHDVRDNGRNNYPDWCRYADTAIKARIGRLIGAEASEIAFVKNTTEGLVNVANGLDWRDGDNLLLPDIEYPSNVYCWMQLARRGVEIKWVKTHDGRVDLADIEAAIDARTRLVSISAVQFSNGFRQDLAPLSELCVSRGVLLNVDAIQWVGSLALDLSQIHVDFLSFGGHKWLLAPIGTGIFYCNSKSLDLLTPPSVGYHSVDRGEAHMDYILDFRPNAGRFEEALVNFPGIWGLDAAVRMHLAVGPRAAEAHILDLTDYAAERVSGRGWTVKSPREGKERSGLLSFGREGIDTEMAATRLCSEGVDLAVRAGVLRISPSIYNNRTDIDRLVDTLPS
ncbi:aminotransferase class V-fold PLP-dependent enzyme [Mesorhizobium australicum]|uniref:Selenocysteine lyase/Cysteine desulfurase n=1 Tax=Mesorhizobium australicum TaxID=536018 RepID=A0A1X7MYX5_9HYPH|nr:aminotransferase class V-fold PLP-dependent enzyme [Mesorhizobium australicum]SMH29671.1 Selenocysteine lyase/Cysteine desulfurase [Mesorhizobium australicum]